MKRFVLILVLLLIVFCRVGFCEDLLVEGEFEEVEVEVEVEKVEVEGVKVGAEAIKIEKEVGGIVGKGVEIEAQEVVETSGECVCEGLEECVRDLDRAEVRISEAENRELRLQAEISVLKKEVVGFRAENRMLKARIKGGVGIPVEIYSQLPVVKVKVWNIVDGCWPFQIMTNANTEDRETIMIKGKTSDVNRVKWMLELRWVRVLPGSFVRGGVEEFWGNPYRVFDISDNKFEGGE